MSNSIFFYDNGTTTAPESALVPTYGPQAVMGQPTCTFPLQTLDVCRPVLLRG